MDHPNPTGNPPTYNLPFHSSTVILHGWISSYFTLLLLEPLNSTAAEVQPFYTRSILAGKGRRESLSQKQPTKQVFIYSVSCLSHRKMQRV
jgi:hypothetical protein